MSITTPSGISTNTITTDGVATVDKILTATVTCTTKFTVNSVTITGVADASGQGDDADADANAINAAAAANAINAAAAAITIGSTIIQSGEYGELVPLVVPNGRTFYLQFTVPAATLAVAGTYTVAVVIDGIGAAKTGILIIDHVGAAAFAWTS